MKPNANAILNILNSDQQIGYFFLIQFDWNTQHFYCTHAHDVTWNGNQYTAVNPVLGIEPPQYSTVVDREVYRMELDALDPLIQSEVDSGIVYKPVSVRIAFTLDGVFQSGADQTVYSYKGRVGGVSQSVNAEKSVYAVECTAPLSDLDANSPRFTTTNAQQLLYPTDTCFKGIHEGSAAVDLEWGKI